MKLLDQTGLAYFWSKIKALIPTKTSDLNNDSGFIGNSDLPLSVANGGTGQTTTSGIRSSLGITDLESDVSDLSDDVYDFFSRVKILTASVSANNGTAAFTFSGTCAFSIFSSGSDATTRSHTHGYCSSTGTVTETKNPSSATGITFTNATNKLTIKNTSQYTMFIVVIVYGHPENISA